MSKIKDALPTPEQCDTCCSFNIELTTNDKIYGRTYGNWPHIYYCNDCRAAVGCHPGTFIPLGRMADRTTRQLRTKAHNEFDRLWQTGLMSRAKAYNWLANQLGIDPSECHISWLSKDQLKDVATLSADYLANNYEALMRRKVKNDAKQQKRRTHN
ncbi:hypothetical protein Kaya_027 [Pseudomonas phage Kaya]|uniref:Uncharacterized protein n=1 Tax=Pseudomonas phage Kaya TaxID=2872675 RepID=A0AAE8X8A3_9CAUD|nr:hypothetical protein PM392_gp57 [Pseudomonas phage Kaya]UAG58564.1 hypothetical protein Kaya_027 [Pseudomonas phage Kaya]